MEPRQPSKLGLRTPAAAAQRQAWPMLNLVQSRVGSEATWSLFAGSDQWICPFCANAVAKRQGHTQHESIARHLENCRHFANGRGAMQPRSVLDARLALAELMQRCQTQPAWRAFDSDGTWISPYTLDRVANVRATSAQPDSFTYQAMLAHVQAQSPAGEPFGAELILLARELHVKKTDVARFVAWHVVTSPAWRWIDGAGLWRCPYTRRAVSGIPLVPAADWPAATVAIARYLTCNCPTFATGALAPLPSELIGSAAGTGAWCLNPPSAESIGAVPIGIEHLLGGSTRFGVPVLGAAGARTPLGSPAVPPMASPTGETSGGYRLFQRKEATSTGVPVIAAGGSTSRFDQPIQATPASGLTAISPARGVPRVVEPPPSAAPEPIAEPTSPRAAVGKLPSIHASDVLDFPFPDMAISCLLYTSDAADDM
jgi:hypothetical protein